jgi:hypothetical protein
MAHRTIKRRPGKTRLNAKDFHLAERSITSAAAPLKTARNHWSPRAVFDRNRRCQAARSRRPPRRPRGAGRRPRGDLLEETDTNFAFEWKGNYQIDGDVFIYTDNETGRLITILGYPAHRLAQVG